jgi:CBS domain-containing protein
MQVREILSVKGTVLYTIAASKPLAEAVATMSEQDVGSLPCFDRGRMVGMLTFREVLAVLRRKGEDWASTTVAEVMVRDPIVGLPDMEVSGLRRLMVEKHMRYLPIMDGEMLLGVISFHDVARAVLEEQGFENRMMRAYIQDTRQEQASEAAP